MNHVKAEKPPNPPADRALARRIRSQAGERATRRFLRGLPAFEIANDLPEQMKALLKRLESVETGSDRTGATAL